MKKLFALLLTVVMMASMMVPAMAAYTPYTPSATTIKHSLRLTEADATGLDYEIVYSYVVTGPTALTVGADNNGVHDVNSAVTGAPTIAPVKYNSADNFNNANKTVEKTLTVNWNNVVVKEPGVYRWDVTQSYTKSDAPQNPSNAAEKFYLFLYVTDDGNNGLTSTFKVATNLNSDGTADSKAKPESLPETYPALTVDLTLTKTVAGTQGSKDQYFPFTITLDVPGNLNHDITFSISATTEGSYELEVPATAYHDKQANKSLITIPYTSTVETVTLWLKHNQSVTISDLIYGTKYTIVEGGNDGYTVSATATGHTDGFTFSGNTAEDGKLEESATVAYTNTKEFDTPTGISLQSGVAFFGIVLAMGMMVLMFVGKRKEQN